MTTTIMDDIERLVDSILSEKEAHLAELTAKNDKLCQTLRQIASLSPGCTASADIAIDEAKKALGLPHVDYYKNRSK